jgi:hypothetical protein
MNLIVSWLSRGPDTSVKCRLGIKDCVGSAVQASLRQPRNQPYRLHNRGFNYYKYWPLSIVNETLVFFKIIFLIQQIDIEVV